MKKPRAKTLRPQPAAPLPEVIEHCRRITTLAELLAQCGQVSLAEPIESRLVANAGGMIVAESRVVEAFLQQLELGRRI